MIPRYVIRVFRALSAWRFERQRPERQRRLYAAIPVFRELDQRREALARQHRPGGRAIDQMKRRVMTERLALECGRRA